MIRFAAALARREFVRFIRQPQRVIGSIGQPLLFWAFLGAGLTPSFQPPGLEGMTYTEYFYPGVLMMLVLFAGIFSTITVIEDRDQGFLQGVVVAPIPRLAIVLGKVGGGTLIALFQALILLVAAPFMGMLPGVGGTLMIVLALTLAALGFTGLGFSIAWTMKSTSGFHAIMMVFLFPLWLLSGALFPMQNVPAWLHWVMTVNPVTHAVTVLRGPFYTAPATLLADGGYLTSLAVLVGWVVLSLWLSVRRVTKRDRGI
ncbi:ABC transporter permease [Caenispirillum bisanense]|uniref:ABC transporter permease n=1 Tax=Caenispirillum bisanense TaxID=414052 RepID=UPI0031E31BB7